MKVPLSWLKEYIPTKLSAEQIGEKLTIVGLEVEAIEPKPLGFEGVVVGKVLETKPHPEADKLCIATISDGSETVQVVCGASNCRVGIKTPFARIGARLEDEDGQTFKIKKTKLRGVESYGMLCGHDELGLPKGEERVDRGIMELPSSYQEGVDLAEIFGDLIFEIALTPNLVHCASIRGIARELAAITEEPVHLPKYSLAEKMDAPVHEKTSVSIENPTHCPRYACRLITGIRVGPSPFWLKERVEMCGMRSVNNIVDITNLVLLEFGHPLHAFDFDTLQEKRIIVRNAKKGEKIVTLDEKEHFPSEEMLLICDGKGPVAIAGVMGAKHTEVGDQTVNILLESAYFEPSQVRKASKLLGIQSEASYRFERGTDPNGIIEALERATAWICEIAGGTALQGIVDVKHQTFARPHVGVRLSRINRILGTQLAMSEVETIFRLLNFEISSIKEDLIEVYIPTYRQDIHQEVDLVEEVARLYGYDHIHKRQSAFYRTGYLSHSPEYLFEKKVRCRCISEGLQEFVTCDLISPSQADLIDADCIPSRDLIKLLNPSSVDQSVLRPSLLPGMLSVIKYNCDHGIYSVSGFEVGRVHFTSKERYLEPSVVSFVLTGERAEHHWESKKGVVDFFELKGLIENVFAGLKIPTCTFSHSQHANFHPGRQAIIRIDEVEIGVMGEVHPATLKRAGLEHPVYFAELNLEDLNRYVPSEIKMHPLPQFPTSSRDWTLTLSDTFPVGEILDGIKKIPSKLLESVSLLDVYRSDKLGSDRKNVTFRFVYRDRNKTISISGVEKEHNRITKNISEHLCQNGESS